MQLYFFTILTIAKLFTLSTQIYFDDDTHFRTSRKCHETTINFETVLVIYLLRQIEFVHYDF